MNNQIFYEVAKIKAKIWLKTRRKYPNANWSSLHHIFCDMQGKSSFMTEIEPSKTMRIEYMAYGELIDVCSKMRINK